jgi:hypothetical protein
MCHVEPSLYDVGMQFVPERAGVHISISNIVAASGEWVNDGISGGGSSFFVCCLRCPLPCVLAVVLMVIPITPFILIAEICPTHEVGTN